MLKAFCAAIVFINSDELSTHSRIFGYVLGITQKMGF